LRREKKSRGPFIFLVERRMRDGPVEGGISGEFTDSAIGESRKTEEVEYEVKGRRGKREGDISVLMKHRFIGADWSF